MSILCLKTIKKINCFLTPLISPVENIKILEKMCELLFYITCVFFIYLLFFRFSLPCLDNIHGRAGTQGEMLGRIEVCDNFVIDFTR